MPRKKISWTKEHLENVRAFNKKQKGIPRTKAVRDKISESHLGLRPSEETRKKLIKSHLGQVPWNKDKKGVYSEKTRRSMGDSEYHKKRKANANYPTVNAELYASFDWKKIRLMVYARDKYICQECHSVLSVKHGKKKICCHHIDYDVNNLSLENLVTLCYSCHAKTNYRRDDWIAHFKNKLQNKKGGYNFVNWRPNSLNEGVQVGNDLEYNLLNSGNPKSKDMAILSEILIILRRRAETIIRTSLEIRMKG